MVALPFLEGNKYWSRMFDLVDGLLVDGWPLKTIVESGAAFKIGADLAIKKPPANFHNGSPWGAFAVLSKVRDGLDVWQGFSVKGSL